MSLADLVIETAEVKVGNTAFTVRGLSFNDIVLLMRPHGEQINDFIDGLKAADDSEGLGGIDPQALLSAAPGVVAMVIALAADEPEMVNKVLHMNPAPQIEALQHIARLTVAEAGSLGKLVGLVTSAIQGVRPAMGELSTGLSSFTA